MGATRQLYETAASVLRARKIPGTVAIGAPNMARRRLRVGEFPPVGRADTPGIARAWRGRRGDDRRRVEYSHRIERPPKAPASCAGHLGSYGDATHRARSTLGLMKAVPTTRYCNIIASSSREHNPPAGMIRPRIRNYPTSQAANGGPQPDRFDKHSVQVAGRCRTRYLRGWACCNSLTRPITRLARLTMRSIASR